MLSDSRDLVLEALALGEIDALVSERIWERIAKITLALLHERSTEVESLHRQLKALREELRRYTAVAVKQEAA